MTTLRTTSRWNERAGVLDRLAVAAEQAHDDRRTRAALAVVVQRLEDAAGAGLGDASREPLVVLQRRLGRASARLAGSRAPLDADLVDGLARALEPQPEVDPRPAVQPATTAALAGC